MKNKKEVSLFIRTELQEERRVNVQLDALLTKFKSYIAGVPDPQFGKDVPYHDPKPYAERAKLRHVHILKHVSTIKIHSSDASDSVIIYTEGSMTPDAFYVIDYLSDKAHETARDPVYMDWLIKKAEAFRMRK